MTSINKPLLRVLRTEINKALIEVGARNGVSLEATNVGFGETNATFKLEVSIISDHGEVVTRELADLREWHPQYEGLAVTVGTKRCKVVGYRRRASKKPFLLAPVPDDGTRYVIGQVHVHRAFTNAIGTKEPTS